MTLNQVIEETIRYQLLCRREPSRHIKHSLSVSITSSYLRSRLWVDTNARLRGVEIHLGAQDVGSSCLSFHTAASINYRPYQ